MKAELYSGMAFAEYQQQYIKTTKESPFHTIFFTIYCQVGGVGEKFCMLCVLRCNRLLFQELHWCVMS